MRGIKLPLLGIIILFTIQFGLGQTPKLLDQWGRELNSIGITLTDWEGFAANPAIFFEIPIPQTFNYPVVVSVDINSHMVYFDSPDQATYYGNISPNLSEKFIVINDPNITSWKFYMAAANDSNDVSEVYRADITIREDIGNRNVTAAIPLTIYDEDGSWTKDFQIILDYRHNTQPYVNDPAVRLAHRSGADDWAFYLAEQDFDIVQPGQGDAVIQPNTGADQTTNNAAFKGFWMYIYGMDNGPNPPWLSHGGSGTCRQHINGIPTELRCSGIYGMEIHGNWFRQGWSTDVYPTNYWQLHDMGDLRAVARHEIGHAMGFTGAYPVFNNGENFIDDKVRNYYGSYPPVNSGSHFDGVIDPVSKVGVFGNESFGDMFTSQWFITKFDLLVLEAIGYKLKDTSPFQDVQVVSSTPSKGYLNVPYIGGITAGEGIQSYYFTVESGSLPSGLILNSFTGEVTGIPTESGDFNLSIKIEDHDPTTMALIEPFNLTIENQLSVLENNPSTLSFNLTKNRLIIHTEKFVTLKLLALEGKIVLDKNLEKGTHVIHNSLDKGVYILRINNSENVTQQTVLIP